MTDSDNDVMRSRNELRVSELQHYKYMAFVMEGVLSAAYENSARNTQTLAETLIIAAIADGTFNRRPVTARDLSKKYKMPYSTVAKYITRMTADELVSESLDPDDSRKKRLWLTAHGAIVTGRTCDSLLKKRDKALATTFSKFGNLYSVK